jgi:hypothetical protein
MAVAWKKKVETALIVSEAQLSRLISEQKQHRQQYNEEINKIESKRGNVTLYTQQRHRHIYL